MAPQSFALIYFFIHSRREQTIVCSTSYFCCEGEDEDEGEGMGDVLSSRRVT